MPDTRQSLQVPHLWPFKDLDTRQAEDGSLIFNQRGIQHICQLNSVPAGVFLPPGQVEEQPLTPAALAWISEWNSLTPRRYWHLAPGAYVENQEILVFHWYVAYRAYGCVPDQTYETHFLRRVQELAKEAAGLHMHLFSEALSLQAASRQDANVSAGATRRLGLTTTRKLCSPPSGAGRKDPRSG